MRTFASPFTSPNLLFTPALTIWLSNAPREPFLDAIYTNSPLNVFPPFAYSCQLADVIDEAKGMTSWFGEVDKLTMVRLYSFLFL